MHRQALSFISNQEFIGFSLKQNWAVFTDERFCALMKHHELHGRVLVNPLTPTPNFLAFLKIFLSEQKHKNKPYAQ